MWYFRVFDHTNVWALKDPPNHVVLFGSQALHSLVQDNNLILRC